MKSQMINQPQTAIPVVFAYPVIRPDPPVVVAVQAPRNEEQVDICSAVACALVVFLILVIFFPTFFAWKGRQQPNG